MLPSFSSPCAMFSSACFIFCCPARALARKALRFARTAHAESKKRRFGHSFHRYCMRARWRAKPCVSRAPRARNRRNGVSATVLAAMRARWRETPRFSRAPRARNRRNGVSATVFAAMRARWLVSATVFVAMWTRWHEKPRVSRAPRALSQEYRLNNLPILIMAAVSERRNFRSSRGTSQGLEAKNEWNMLEY